MYRDIQTQQKHCNLLFDDGGLGDCIGRLPAVKYCLDNHPHIFYHLWIPDYFVEFAKNCLSHYDKLTIRGFSQAKKYKEHFMARAFSRHDYNNLASHLTDNAFHVLVNKQVDLEDMNYIPLNLDKVDISKYNLPDKYVIMTTGYTATVREFYPHIINSITDYIRANGYEVVFLGKKITETGLKDNNSKAIKGNFNDKVDYSIGIDLIDKTTILEGAKVIANSKCIVGLDNGLLHLAGCTDTAIVGGFSSVEPKYRMPYRKNQLGWNYYPVVPPESVKCRFCQSNWTFTYNHDFKECYYKDVMCLKETTAEMYIEQLKKVL